MNIKYIALLACAFAANPIHAAENKVATVTTKEPASKADSTWKADAELGYVKTTGNTDTESTNLKMRAENERVDWKHSFQFETVRNSDTNGTTAERYFASAKTAYNINQDSYAFGKLQYVDDRFSGYDYQASAVLGYGYHIYKTETLKWDAELGAGIRENKPESAVATSEGLIYLGTDLQWQISKSAQFREEIDIEAGEDSTVSKSVTALKTKINSSLASKITYTVRHNSKVPVGKKKTDTETGISLVYTF